MKRIGKFKLGLNLGAAAEGLHAMSPHEGFPVVAIQFADVERVDVRSIILALEIIAYIGVCKFFKLRN